ncbi:hypothetical protein DRJ25_02065 [Candidatus Woesearchaeota archaeon]|nr:MAG: hypothetical protein DRJ25_02065 [Candidatus Woesearchaeota archaeon]
MRRFDAISQQLVRILQTSDQPLETAEIIALVQSEFPVSRKIILKRLHDLKDSEEIEAKFLGSGKGVWVWWRKSAFKKGPLPDHSALEPSEKKLASVIDSSLYPLETKEVTEQVPEFSREQVLRKLTVIWGDGVIKGKQVGSGKGVWIWWRVDAFEK